MEKKYRIGIVASRFNGEYVDGLVDSAVQVLEDHTVLVRRVPGAFEIPLAVQRLLETHEADAVLTFGLIWQGETPHADLIGKEVTRALMDLSLEYDTPVLHAVLMVRTEDQAKARCLGTDLNRGRETAEAALSMLEEN